jgi:methylmalonyl-CoA mutase N-terminal domain/subunit
VRSVRAKRDAAKHAAAVGALRDACMSNQNLVPFVLDAVRANATLGEISDVFREAYGVYREPAVF